MKREWPTFCLDNHQSAPVRRLNLPHCAAGRTEKAGRGTRKVDMRVILLIYIIHRLSVVCALLSHTLWHYKSGSAPQFSETKRMMNNMKIATGQPAAAIVSNATTPRTSHAVSPSAKLNAKQLKHTRPLSHYILCLHQYYVEAATVRCVLRAHCFWKRAANCR